MIKYKQTKINNGQRTIRYTKVRFWRETQKHNVGKDGSWIMDIILIGEVGLLELNHCHAIILLNEKSLL